MRIKQRREMSGQEGGGKEEEKRRNREKKEKMQRKKRKWKRIEKQRYNWEFYLPLPLLSTLAEV